MSKGTYIEVEHSIYTTSLQYARIEKETFGVTLFQSLVKDRERRVICPLKQYNEAYLVVYTLTIIKETFVKLYSQDDVVSNWDCKIGSMAMEEEMESLHKKEIRIYNSKQNECHKMLVTIRKMGYTSKDEESRDQALLLAKVFNQIVCVKFNDVLSLVVKHISIHVLLKLIAAHDLRA